MNVQRYTDLSNTQKNFCIINFVLGKISVAFHVDFGRCRGATDVDSKSFHKAVINY
jgi:hypothetical protein